MNIEKIAKRRGAWLDATTNTLDGIILSSRVRLARNIKDKNFIPRLAPEDRRVIIDSVITALKTNPDYADIEFVDTNKLNRLHAQLLVERHLVSHALIEERQNCGVAFNQAENIAIMINEEDHLRMQGLNGGFSLIKTYNQLDSIDNLFASLLGYSYNEELGYLTACPTNVGTGMRVSVMIHLPALVMTRHIDKAFRAIHDLRLAIRGFFGEGTDALGDIYQISNQITLGRSETEIMQDLIAVIEELASYEQKARSKLLDSEKIRVEDRVERSFALLKNARIMSTKEAMNHLSSIRLGVNLGLIKNINQQKLNDIMLFCQSAHLQCRQGVEYLDDELDIVRADYIREELN